MPTSPTATLAHELYELMRGDGATSAAISKMPALMSLSYIRAEAPAMGEDAYDEALAATIRNFIEQATYALEEPLSQRDDKDVDRGAAARCLLGLDPGTTLLSERRKRAAGFLAKDVRTVTKRREVKGRLASHEMTLMEQLAGQLWDREADFLRDASHSGDPYDVKAGDSPWLAAAHESWSSAKKLVNALRQCSGLLVLEGMGHIFPNSDYDSLEYFGKFWRYVAIPVRPGSSADVGKPGEPDSLSLGGSLIPILFSSSPFDGETLEKLASGTALKPSATPVPVVSELITPWRAWLQLCHCGDVVPVPDRGSCPVHRVVTTLGLYINELEKCWDELRDPYRTPSMYPNNPSPAHIASKYGLRLPD